MKPLIVLLLSFALGTFIIRVIKKEYDFTLSARIAMSVMLVFTAIGHFIFTDGMTMMIPTFIPFKKAIVYLSGIFEILVASGLLILRFQKLSGWAMVAFLLLMLPANVYASMNNINYQQGSFDGHGMTYLWFRIPLQVLFIFWVYISALKKSAP